MSYGVPAVATNIAAEGMNLKDRESILIANDSEKFATGVLSLYKNEKLWNHIKDNSCKVLKSQPPTHAVKNVFREFFKDMRV